MILFISLSRIASTTNLLLNSLIADGSPVNKYRGDFWVRVCFVNKNTNNSQKYLWFDVMQGPFVESLPVAIWRGFPVADEEKIWVGAMMKDMKDAGWTLNTLLCQQNNVD